MDNIFNLLNQNPTFLYLAVAVLGLTIGSFFNVVIFRLPKMMEYEWHQQCAELTGRPSEVTEKVTLSTPASTCPHCGHKIRPWENIPVISYLMLRGKCASCRKGISLRYPIIEIVTAILAVMVICQYQMSWMGLAAVVFAWMLLIMTMIDFDTQLLPDNLTLPLLWLGLIVNLDGMFTSINEAVWGAVFGYLSLWTVYHLFKLLTGKEGMGFGDFKLLAAIGAWLGWKMLPLVILLSSLVGAVVGISMILMLGRDRNIPIPFGPYLAAAGFIAMLWGQSILDSYLGLFAQH